MDAELKRRVEALRRPLELAAADNFRGVRRVQGLGNVLRIACDGLIARLEQTAASAAARGASSDTATFVAPGALAHWRITLGTWEQLGEDQQAIEVARGMRLIARFPTGPERSSQRERLTAAPPRVAERSSGSLRSPGTDVHAATSRSPGTSASSDRHLGRRTSLPPDSSPSTAPDTRSSSETSTSPDTHVGTRTNRSPDTSSRPDTHVGVRTSRSPERLPNAVPGAETGPSSGTRASSDTHAGRRTSRSPDTSPSRAPNTEDATMTNRSPDTSSRPDTHVGAKTSRSSGTRASSDTHVGAKTSRARDARTSSDTRTSSNTSTSSDTSARQDTGTLSDTRVGAKTPGKNMRSGTGTGTGTGTSAGPESQRAEARPASGSASASVSASASARARSRSGGASTHGGPRGDDLSPRGDNPSPPGGDNPSPRSDTAASPDADAPRRARRKPASSEASTEVDPLAAPTHSLPGIGPAFAAKMAERGLATVEDLLWCLPRRYDDVRDAKQLAEVLQLPEGARATFVARVTSARMVFVRGRRWAEVRVTSVAEGSADPTRWFETPAVSVIRWFNVWAGIEKRMPTGSIVTLSGVVKLRSGRAEFANPDILAIDVPETDAGDAKKALPTILARYPDVTGVPASRLRQACQTACTRIAAIADDGVPASVEQAAGLVPLAETLERLHMPAADITVDELAALNRGDSVWQRRLAFGELFALGVAVAMRRRERRGDAAVPCPRDARVENTLARALPFGLTGAQRRAIDELGDDLAASSPMNRLLQGDVGAGKTCVAFAAALQAASAKRQTAVMAPTEILAEQHFETWKAWNARAGAGLRIELLTASTPRPLRASLLALVGAGTIDVVIGTHALLAESVGFGALGLVVIDEQHRFGVAQRARLRDKGDGQGAPHLLVMTATPIPRTLALTAYGDLDVSVLDELPPGRVPVTTQLAGGKRGEQGAYKLVGERVAAGERAYVVCPKVEDDNEDSNLRDATTVAGEVAAALPKARVGLVHGRLDGEARDRVMRAFKSGELDVLVATTVIEVGVDVPEATVMVIHDAERFGLAQLHQLRGRVGRGTAPGHCVLVSHGSISEDGRARLDAMASTTDGFVIAEADLALRGPGELLGPRQAGIPRLRFGSLQQHTALLLEARRHAEQVLDDDPTLSRAENGALRNAIARRFAQSVYGPEGG